MKQVYQEVDKRILVTLNNLYEIEKKLELHGDTSNIKRNVDKIRDVFAEIGVFYEDPKGQPFKETRTDLEASIAGSSTENLVVIDVIKPIVRAGEVTPSGDIPFSRVIQKGIVIVESKLQEDEQ